MWGSAKFCSGTLALLNYSNDFLIAYFLYKEVYFADVTDLSYSHKNATELWYYAKASTKNEYII